MPSLRELQCNFASAIFAGGVPDDQLLACCGGAPEQVAQGLDAYRRSVLANLSSAVQATYPVVRAIVGHDFLVAATLCYAHERPSTSGDLNAFGHDFGDFLAHYGPAMSLPYLSDMARLEWQVLQVHGAEEAREQDLSRLTSTPPERWGELRFRLDPAHACLASDWPIARIWEVNQPDYIGDFQVDFDRAQTVLIQRRQAGIVVEVLDPGEGDFLQALEAGLDFAAAVEAAAQIPAFDLAVTLQRFIANGLLRQAC
ncbi:hypothetical protein GALL_480450 [mine drainage metagenome]|uniref:Putative DNA-binding domain-containing protein n=1 Tax=mine drainage metagenome TaxID=410659 RepID=A0A1J5PHT7_9ZZZZ